MGKFVTPAGVVIELGEEAARAVGYKPVEEKTVKRGRPKKAEDPSSDES